jgi:dihydropteroate synthase/2-amino-4-hydroxy-6-hydroxymethyldihydropteridine diphosphokinase
MVDKHTVYLALGSNLGNRAAHLHAALQAIRPYAHVEATSFLYETIPLYVTDQPKYLNAVCRFTTALGPQELLQALEATMKALGRVRTIRYGPRVIDLDILFYDDLVLETPDLTIPHALLHERRFVLEPLCDLSPALAHPRLGQTMQTLLAQLTDAPLSKVLPMGDRIWHWGAKTYIMGILNVTPDSFSGDGIVKPGADLVASAVTRAQRLVAEGADCLDLGGISTRPGHTLIPVEEELARIEPVIQALAQTVNVPISIDTFRAEVAQAALSAGAQIINDIWALRFDRTLAELSANRAAPLVLMHNRMEPPAADYRAQLQSLPLGPAGAYRDIIEDMRADLQQSLALAQQMGVPRWLLITDPGLGFGKTLEQQLALIARLNELKQSGYPLLFGASRKSFIGRVLGGLPTAERLEGTLAASVLAIDRGADILRVHDVQAMSRAARLADAIVGR